jgi:hypothetical protein
MPAPPGDLVNQLLLMPRDGAIIFADLIGKLDVLYVHCPKCSRAGRYGVQHLVEARGRNAKLIDWLGLAEGAVVTVPLAPRRN